MKEAFQAGYAIAIALSFLRVPTAWYWLGKNIAVHFSQDEKVAVGWHKFL